MSAEKLPGGAKVTEDTVIPAQAPCSARALRKAIICV